LLKQKKSGIMKLQIARISDDTIMASIDTSDVKDKAEVAHFIMELERFKNKLQHIWEEMD